MENRNWSPDSRTLQSSILDRRYKRGPPKYHVSSNSCVFCEKGGYDEGESQNTGAGHRGLEKLSVTEKEDLTAPF